MKRSKTMSEPRMLGRLIGKIRQPQLPDPPQPLKLRRIDQRNNKPPLIRVGVDTDDVMDRVAVYPFSQSANFSTIRPVSGSEIYRVGPFPIPATRVIEIQLFG